MINRPRTAFVSIAAVAVSMIVLGTDARAKSSPAASPQNYMRFLRRLPDARTGMSLTQTIMTKETTRDGLKEILGPNPRQVQRMANLFNQEMSVYSQIQANISALVADSATLSQQYVALEALKYSLVSQGRIRQAQRVGTQAGQVASEMYSLPALISTEIGVATPTK
jgi:Spy/CpxP family protein refolding chaperone